MEYRYAGPDGEGIGLLPPGTGAALGSEYCVHLLPGPDALARAIDAARGREVPLLLLTPYFRDSELKRTLPLFRAIPHGANVEVAVNDWGLLLTLHALFPELPLSVGRLLSGQKRCPRIAVSDRLTPEGRAWHAEGLHSSASAREFLAAEYGVRGIHRDLLPWARPPAEGTVHGPFAIVTVTDACPWIGGISSSAVESCPRPCRGESVVLREPTMGGEMIQRGKARFVRTGIPPAGREGVPVRRVLYDDLP